MILGLDDEFHIHSGLGVKLFSRVVPDCSIRTIVLKLEGLRKHAGCVLNDKTMIINGHTRQIRSGKRWGSTRSAINSAYGTFLSGDVMRKA